ncbi:sensor histidine kinase [Deferribacter autotrophicus]|uniref:sensor histidine kinase n=1 Tax=Deferribacter autotrophicus TaxID=500465 RepID=UPI00165EB081|nr:ATP-binding protein [Deferribacter autotrophicus]
MLFFYLIFLFIYLTNINKTELINELIFLAVVIGFFSTIIFIANTFIHDTIILYIQSFFDTIIITYLMYRTNFLDSPYIIFFAFVVGYLSFVKGFKGGLVGLIQFLFATLILFIVFKKSENINITYLTNQFQYLFAFILIYALSSYLNYNYQKRVQELKNLQNIQQLIVKNIGIGIMLIDKTGNILSCNDAGKKILNLKMNSLLDRTLKDIGLVLKGDENIIKYNDKFIGYKLQDFIDESNKKVGKLLIFQDVTEKELLKIELQKKQKLANLGQFATIIAHEIKNPLGAIKGSIQILKKQFKADKLINIVEREINRLDMILNNLLYVSRPAKKNKDLIKISEFFNDFVDYFKIYDLYEELKINLNVIDDFEILISDIELRQIIWNLIINSYEAKNDVHITITTYIKDGKKIFSYSDNGPGISSEIIKDVMKPFYSTKSKGSGLGLYIIKLICDKNSIIYKLYSNKEVNGFQMDFIFK